jgi:uncharacterized LabA/DUF88 family protein
MRVSAFVDGFNLYHAIDDLGRPHLKWLNLRLLSEVFAPSPQCTLTDVFYFTAFATWRPASYRRHREYVKALAAARVTTVLGNFKEKDRECFTCKAAWRTHEEKESDVNLALCLLRGAFRDTYDRALVMTQDSDIAPAVAMVLREFPSKSVRIVTPVGFSHSFQLLRAVGGERHAVRMKAIHLERSLFGREVLDPAGNLAARRPVEYDPPPMP